MHPYVLMAYVIGSLFLVKSAIEKRTPLLTRKRVRVSPGESQLHRPGEPLTRKATMGRREYRFRLREWFSGNAPIIQESVSEAASGGAGTFPEVQVWTDTPHFPDLPVRGAIEAVRSSGYSRPVLVRIVAGSSPGTHLQVIPREIFPDTGDPPWGGREVGLVTSGEHGERVIWTPDSLWAWPEDDEAALITWTRFGLGSGGPSSERLTAIH